MEIFPNETNQKIFDQLSHYQLQKCLQVCKAWNKYATPSLGGCEEMHGYKEIKERSLSVTPACKSYKIYRLKFIMLKHTGDPPSTDEFLGLMKKKCNVRVLDFVNVNPIYYLIHLARYSVKLDQLGFILVPRSKWIDVADHYSVVAHKYRKTIDCLGMDVPRKYLKDFPSYLEDFTNLCALDIRTSTPLCLELEAILDACPRLEQLIIEGPFNVQSLTGFEFLSTEETGTINAPKQYALYSLKIDRSQDNITFRSFITIHLPHLRDLYFREDRFLS
jgi:hypothetical protein